MQMRLFGEPSRAGHALHGGPAGHERMDVFFVGFLRRPRPLALGRSASRLVMGWWLLGVGSGRAARVRRPAGLAIRRIVPTAWLPPAAAAPASA
jgi:hypothetical protein